MAGRRMTKAQLFAELASATDLPKKKVAELFEALNVVLKKQLTGRGPGEFVFPGLLKVRVVHRAASPEREGIDPRTREKIVIPAKGPSRRVRTSALKGLRELVL